jgi:hypothetical protein
MSSSPWSLSPTIRDPPVNLLPPRICMRPEPLRPTVTAPVTFMVALVSMFNVPALPVASPMFKGPVTAMELPAPLSRTVPCAPGQLPADLDAAGRQVTVIGNGQRPARARSRPTHG